jgi:hypothetical protein
MTDFESVPQRQTSGWRTAGTYLAGWLMIMIGIFQALAGLAAIINNRFFVIGREYVYAFSLTTWGWIHLIVGVVILVAGCAILVGKLWARVVGIILALISAVVNFAFIPYYPFWSILIIALDVFVIWALATHGPEAEV